jgi:hypothetical protein
MDLALSNVGTINCYFTRLVAQGQDLADIPFPTGRGLGGGRLGLMKPWSFPHPDPLPEVIILGMATFRTLPPKSMVMAPRLTAMATHHLYIGLREAVAASGCIILEPTLYPHRRARPGGRYPLFKGGQIFLEAIYHHLP